MARAYATEAEYITWSGDATASIGQSLLVRASLVIDSVLIGTVYDTNSSSLPTNPDIIEALSDAVCAQIQWWDEQGDTTGSGATSQFQGASIGSASYTKGYSAAGSSAGNTSPLAPMAYRTLNVAGLLPAVVQTHG